MRTYWNCNSAAGFLILALILFLLHVWYHVKYSFSFWKSGRFSKSICISIFETSASRRFVACCWLTWWRQHRRSVVGLGGGVATTKNRLSIYHSFILLQHLDTWHLRCWLVAIISARVTIIYSYLIARTYFIVRVLQLAGDWLASVCGVWLWCLVWCGEPN